MRVFSKGAEWWVNLGGSRESARPVGALQGFVKSHTGCDAGHNNRDQQKVALAGFERRAALPGPNATRADIKRAALHLAEGGLFGYRFQFPALRVGRHEVYWHRPLVAFLPPRGENAVVLPDAPLGHVLLDDQEPARLDIWEP